MVWWFDESKVKPIRLTKLLFETGDKINLSIVKNNYIWEHYNCADISMLEDFDELKSLLNIVNMHFFTIGKHLRINDSFVYLIDTMLLNPPPTPLEKLVYKN